MDLTTLERLPMWIGGRAHSPATTRYGEVTKGPKGLQAANVRKA